MRKTPFAELYLGYENRLCQIGPSVGLTGCTLVEFDDASGARPKARTATLAHIGKIRQESAMSVALDEAGTQWSSVELADNLARWRDDGHQSCAFFIGGAYGLDPDLRAACDQVLSLGSLTLPHLLARIVLVEQLYRASCILKGHPYHHG